MRTRLGRTWLRNRSVGALWSHLAGAAALPVFLLVYLVRRFAVDVPLVDEWSQPYDLERFLEGRWTLADLLRSHNGHRLLVSRLLLVPLGAWTGFDVRWGMLLSFLVALATFALWLACARDVGALDVRRRDGVLALLALSTSFFSLAQWENWLWGTQLQVFLVVAFSLGSLRALAAPRLSGRRLVAGAGLGALAALSQAPGVAAWWIGGVLVATRDAPRRRQIAGAAAWFVSAAILTWLYFRQGPLDSAPPRPAILSDPWGWFLFVCTFLGGPIAPFAGVHFPATDRGFARWLGVALVAAFLALAAAAWRRSGSAESAQDRPPRRAGGDRTLAAWGAWAIACATLAALGRAEGGSAVALASRYVGLATPLVGSIILWLAAHRDDGLAGGPPGLRSARAARGVLLLSLLLGLSAFKSLESLPRFVERAETIALPREALVAGGPLFELERLQPQVEMVEQWRPVLVERRLSVFRPGAWIRDPRPAASPHARLDRPAQRIAPRQPLPVRVPGGMRPALRVRLENTSSEPWPAFGRDITIAGAVLVSARFRPLGGGESWAESPRARLPRDLWPGESVDLDLCLAVPAPPGDYTVEISALQQDEFRFADLGVAALEFPVRVEPMARPLRGLQKLARRAEYYLGLWPCR